MTSSPPLGAHIPLDRESRVPLHRQIYDGFRRAVHEGWLQPGQRVPSTRALAAELGVSRFPVLTAYELLLGDGCFEGRVGAGTYVSPARPSTPSVPPLPRPRDEADLGPFRVSLPALDRFPHARWARLVARHARAPDPAHMAYGDPAGVERLRSAIASHVRSTRAVRCDADQVLVVSGSQAALRVVAAALLAPRDVVAVEEPGYSGAHAALGAGGPRLLRVPVDDGGLDVATLDRHDADIRAVYVTPSHQYPLGVPLTPARRRELLEWADRREAWVLEDDYDSDYWFGGTPLGAIQGMDGGERVVYIGTFSKVLFPGLRLGYLIVPRTLRDRAARAREALDLFSPPLQQLALADFILEGHLARHLRRMHPLYRARRQALLDSLARECPGLSVVPAAAGLHVTALFAEHLDDGTVVRRMAECGLTATPLSACYSGARARSGLLLGFGGFTEAQIVDAAGRLGWILRELG